MPINKGMMASNSDEWATPKWLFEWLNKRFHFTVDAAATRENSLYEDCFTNGLEASWKGERVFVNPPYSNILAWMQKCANEASNGCELICALVPVRTDTRWWHNYVQSADLVHFIKGRLKFGDGAGTAPFPSALLFWFGLRNLGEGRHDRR